MVRQGLHRQTLYCKKRQTDFVLQEEGRASKAALSSCESDAKISLEEINTTEAGLIGA
jgi:hypothetical protein